MNTSWILVAVGAAAVLAGVISVTTGRTTQFGGRKFGIARNYDVTREQSPFQFWFLVMLQFLIGISLLTYGVMKLIG